MRKKNEVRLAWTGWVAVMVLSVSPLMAGTDLKEITPPAVDKPACDKDWTIELASGALFSNVRDSAPVEGYTLIPIAATASLKLDDVGLDNFLGGWLRGYSEFYFSGGYYQIVSGPEDHFEGIMVGPRYNFVQPGWKIIPFISGGVGVGFINSRPQFGGMGEDFNFSFEVTAGAKYMITDDWFARLAIEYKHISNAGMSEPTNPNNPIDALGPQLSVGYTF